MSVLLVTSLGDIVVDLFTDRCPLTCKNFLKLCKIKYYNGCLFHSIQKDFTAQTGDPTGTGSGGDSIYKFLYGEQARFFSDEIHHDLKHSKMGTVVMASAGKNLNASQFYFTLRDDLDYLDEKHTVFGEVAEGLETLTRINEAFVDEKNRPFKNIRIKHTYILEDPFDDPPQLAELIPDTSPEGKPKDEADDDVRLEDDWVPMDEQLGSAELEEVLRTKDAHSSAVVLESIGDIPDAEIRPPDNVLFVCKLNPVTEDEDLHTIFSRFGTVLSAEVIRDWKTGDSLCYAFIEFETRESCEQAFFKMDNALIDDRRIHVDFSQSVAKLWSQYRRKDHQMSKGKGCFKCGSLDHIAKDCTGVPTAKLQPLKYVLKDENMQHGGDNNSRYDLVFDEEAPESPKQGIRHQGLDLHDREDQHKMSRHHSNDRSCRDKDRKDTGERHGREDKIGDRGEDRSRCDRRDQNYLERANGEKPREKNEQSNRKRSADNYDRERRDFGGHRKRSADSDRERKDYGDHKKRSADVEEREMRNYGDGRKRSAEADERERRDYGDHQGKRSMHMDSRDYGNKRDGAEDSYRGGSKGEDGYRARREERADKYRRMESVDDHGRDRTQRWGERKR